RVRWRRHSGLLGEPRVWFLRHGRVDPNDDPPPADRRDLPWITTDVLTRLPRDRDLARHDLGTLEGMPQVGVPSRGAEGPLLAAAADQDRQSLLHRPYEDLGVDELVVLPRERHALSVDELANDLRSLREAVRSLARRAEI